MRDFSHPQNKASNFLGGKFRSIFRKKIRSSNSPQYDHDQFEFISRSPKFLILGDPPKCRITCPFLGWEVLNGVGVDGVGVNFLFFVFFVFFRVCILPVSFPFFFFLSLFCDFLLFFLFFSFFLCYFLFLLFFSFLFFCFFRLCLSPCLFFFFSSFLFFFRFFLVFPFFLLIFFVLLRFSLFFAFFFVFLRLRRIKCFLHICRQLLSMVPQFSATGKTAKNCKKGISLRPRLHQPRQKLSD